MRVALVSCVKTKRSTPHPAGDLYTSTLFLGLRKYAETYADRWFILSAKHGLLDPDRVTAPYEQTLNNMSAPARSHWAEKVKGQLAAVLPVGAEVIVLAGARYRENLLPFLRQRGHSVTVPLEGLPFGRQLQHLNALFSRGPKLEGEVASRLDSASQSVPSARQVARATFLGDPLLSDLTSRTAVLNAIAEFDDLGREAFLEKYGYGPARRYFLEYNSRQYDSKAIVGVAYGHQHPDRGPLENSQFSGGERTVQRKLEDLGFSLFVFPESRHSLNSE